MEQAEEQQYIDSVCQQMAQEREAADQSVDHGTQNQADQGESSDTNSETSEAETEADADVAGATVAGISRERREAKKKRLKPVKDAIAIIKAARQPNRQHQSTASRMLARMVESNKAISKVRQAFASAHAKRRRDRRNILKRAGAVEQTCSIRRWQLNCHKDKQQKAVAAARKFHSVLIQVEVKQGSRWVSMVCIADTGSGVTIFRLTDLTTAIHTGNPI